jgi:ribonucleoside-diphosphate reductase alpha chain
MLDFQLTPLGQIVWEDRYGLKNEHGNLIEKDILETFRRAAKAMASKEKDPSFWEERFYDIMANKYFCPAGRILAHAGTHYSQLLNCFVLPFEDDSLEAIMDTAKKMAVIQKFGGGTGFNYSTLRPAGSRIKGVNGRSCGVPGFINMMSVTSEVIEQGGSRRGANLGLLEVSHPDVWEYISYKAEHSWDHLLEFMDVKDQNKWEAFKFENSYKLQMYNISIGITDDFLAAVKGDTYWPLLWKDVEWELYTIVFTKVTGESLSFEVTADSTQTAIWKVKKKIPYPGAKDKFEVKAKRKIKASEIWEKMCYNAWADGCPGLINLSTTRKFHNLEYVNPVLTTNPCGEQPLGPYGSCNLSSLILPSFYQKSDPAQRYWCINYAKLKEVIHTAVRFADNVIDNCEFPIPEIKEVAMQERRIGLGTMGVHDLLIKMQLGYDTEEGRAVVATLLEFIRNEAYRASIEIAREKGSFPLFSSPYIGGAFIRTLPVDIQREISGGTGIRNSCLLSQAPTGTTGTMYNCSTGCEPWFALSLQRNTRLGSYEDGCPDYIQWKKENPDKPTPSYFKTAQEIAPEDHIKMMVLFSKFIDSAVSKTVNLPNSATVEDVKKAFEFAMEQGAKGITIFRDGSKTGVLVNKDKEKILEEAHGTIQGLQGIEKTLDDSRAFPIQRGNIADGSTYRIPLQHHNLYVTVNKNENGNLVEVFAVAGKSKRAKDSKYSGIENSWAEALGRLASLCLRAGVDPCSVISNLKNITSDKPVFVTIGNNENSELIPSPPHAIARVMEDVLNRNVPQFKSSEVTCQQIPEIKKGNCSECGSSDILLKGPNCYECKACGYSGCGS